MRDPSNFTEFLLELLAPLGPVSARRMFGGVGLFHGGMMFGLHVAFAFSIVACLVAAAASALRGGIFHHGEALALAPRAEEQHAN